MFARRVLALSLSVAFHGVLALIFASRAWNSAPVGDGVSEPSLTVVSLSASPAEPSKPQPEAMQPPVRSNAASQAQAMAQFTRLPVREDASQAVASVLAEASGQGQSLVRDVSIGAAGVPVANTQPASQAVLASSAPSDVGKAARAEDAYGAEVHRWIERRKSYPANLAGRKLEGTVTVEFQIDRHGKLSGPVRIVRSSGEGALDRLAQQQIQAATPFPRPPASSTWKRRTFTIPMTYRSRA